MTARSTWKGWERRTAVALGGRRIPVTGIDRGDRDGEGGMFYLQNKLRKDLPSWLFDWLGGIVATAKPAGKVGVLVLKTPRMRDAEALVVMRWGDFVDLHGPVKEGNRLDLEPLEPIGGRGACQ